MHGILRRCWEGFQTREHIRICCIPVYFNWIKVRQQSIGFLTGFATELRNQRKLQKPNRKSSLLTQTKSYLAIDGDQRDKLVSVLSLHTDEVRNLRQELDKLPLFRSSELQLLEDVSRTLQGFSVSDRSCESCTFPKTMFPRDSTAVLLSFLDDLPDGENKVAFIQLLQSRDHQPDVPLDEVDPVNLVLESQHLGLRSDPAAIHRLAERLFSEHLKMTNVAQVWLRVSELPEGDLSTEFENESVIVDVVE